MSSAAEVSAKKMAFALVEQEFKEVNNRALEEIASEGSLLLRHIREAIESYRVCTVETPPLFFEEWRQKIVNRAFDLADEQAKVLVRRAFSEEPCAAFQFRLFHFGKRVIKAAKAEELMIASGYRPATILEAFASFYAYEELFKMERIIAGGSSGDTRSRYTHEKDERIAVIDISTEPIGITTRSYENKLGTDFHFLGVRKVHTPVN
ncbi:MAG: hypothetical protein U5L75_00490 [Candidatus Campbellbacteria bacterium]|nr:hypothetical protein [Candidatus Campbellbacteria bacterium]